jgi:Calpain family cysteine protease
MKQVIEGWVLLLEKAWAKVFGSYETIDAGFTQDALFALTGF